MPPSEPCPTSEHAPSTSSSVRRSHSPNLAKQQSDIYLFAGNFLRYISTTISISVFNLSEIKTFLSFFVVEYVNVTMHNVNAYTEFELFNNQG